MKSGKSRRARPWGRIESLEPREMMTLEPTLLGNFLLCRVNSAAVEFRGETSYYLSAAADSSADCRETEQSTVVRTDGTQQGTFTIGRELGDIVGLESLFVFNDTLYFATEDRNATLFGTDGSPESAVKLSQNMRGSPFVFDGGLYFTSLSGRYLWRSDGTELTKIQDFRNQSIDHVQQLGNQLFFSMRWGTTIWTSDGTRAGTRQVFDFGRSEYDFPLRPVVWDERSESFQHSFYRVVGYDGDVERQLLTFVNYDPISGESTTESVELSGRRGYPFGVDSSQAILSVVKSGEDREFSLMTDWYTDWTAEGTWQFSESLRAHLVIEPLMVGEWQDGLLYAFFRDGTDSYITSVGPDSSQELFRTHRFINSINVLPSGEAMLVETILHSRIALWLVDESGAVELDKYARESVSAFTEWNVRHYFHAHETQWVTDGTREGTEIVDERTSNVHFTNHAIYYEKNNELWRSLGDAGSTVRVHDASPGQIISTDDFVVFGTDEQFVVNKYLSSPVSAEEYLGVEVGEVVLELSNGNALIFEKQNETGLTEYWHTDGTPAGTYPIGILSPRREYHEYDRFCGFPERFTEAGDYVLYTVDTCVEYQTWSMHLYPEPVKPVLADVRRELDVGEANDVALADFDNDGDLDAYFIRDAADEIWWNDGAGFYEDSGIRFETEGTNDVELVDVDLDGDVDIVVAAVGGNRIFLRDGEDSYREIPLEREEGVVSVDVSAGDVNGDERPDFYFANQSESGGAAEDNLVLSRDALWQTTTGYGVQTSYASAFADFDEDGDLDLVVSNDAERGGYFYENRGPAGVRLQRQGEVWAAPGVVDAFRLHSNPTPDEYPGNIGLVGLGAGPGPVYPTSSRCCNRTWGHQLGDLPQNDFAIGDFDSDGDNDLFFAAAGDHGNSLWLNSNGQFQFWQSNLDTGVATRAVAAGDVDGDGDTDVIAVTEEGRSRIYLNLSADTFGDLDLDGGLTDRDVATLRSNFATSDAIYADGDLNNDQLVTFEDYLLLSEQFANRSVEQDGHFREV